MGTELDLNDCAGNSELAMKELNELREYAKTLKAGIDAVSYLIVESSGVSGLHRNGNEASWDWLLYTSWLEDFKKAEEAKQPDQFY